MTQGLETGTTRKLHQPKSWLRRFALPITLVGTIVAGGAYVFRDKILNFFNPQPPKITAEVLAALDPAKCNWNVQPTPIDLKNDPRFKDPQTSYARLDPITGKLDILDEEEFDAATIFYRSTDIATRAIIEYARLRGVLPGNSAETLSEMASQSGISAQQVEPITVVAVYQGNAATLLERIESQRAFSGDLLGMFRLDERVESPSITTPNFGTLDLYNPHVECPYIDQNGISWNLSIPNTGIAGEWIYQESKTVYDGRVRR